MSRCKALYAIGMRFVICTRAFARHLMEHSNQRGKTGHREADVSTLP